MLFKLARLHLLELGLIKALQGLKPIKAFEVKAYQRFQGFKLARLHLLKIGLIKALQGVKPIKVFKVKAYQGF